LFVYEACLYHERSHLGDERLKHHECAGIDQVGLLIRPCGKNALESARRFVECRYGRVMRGQCDNETENHVAVDLATDW
jgi:hypothetical protein